MLLYRTRDALGIQVSGILQFLLPEWIVSSHSSLEVTSLSIEIPGEKHLIGNLPPFAQDRGKLNHWLWFFLPGKSGSPMKHEGPLSPSCWSSHCVTLCWAARSANVVFQFDLRSDVCTKRWMSVPNISTPKWPRISYPEDVWMHEQLRLLDKGATW